MADSLLDLSVVIPAYNERWRILGTLLEMIEYLEKISVRYEVIVVDDGSSDETQELVGRLARLRPQIRIIRHETNRGKGHAVRSGVLAAQGKRVLFADADGATPAAELHRLSQALDQGADVAIGSRAVFAEDVRVSTWFHRKYLGRFFNLIVNILIIPGIADTQCGFKLFTNSAGKFLFSFSRSEGFSFDVEILYLAKRAGLSVREIPVNWTNIPGSKVNVIIDGLKMLRDIIIFRLRHRSVTEDSYRKYLSEAAAV
ncbi:MAG: glycosyltransferase family 2 protein [Deltaproteobacteria bacterium]|nr:glycosyltransferase family 2 protein [Deltaproteobacteria bacterium]